MPASSVPIARFVGLDVHKRSLMVGVVNARQQMVLRLRGLSWDGFGLWRQRHLHSTDGVVLEATTNVWHLYDQLVSMIASCRIVIEHSLSWL
jgi:hypothetical protein